MSLVNDPLHLDGLTERAVGRRGDADGRTKVEVLRVTVDVVDIHGGEDRQAGARGPVPTGHRDQLLPDQLRRGRHGERGFKDPPRSGRGRWSGRPTTQITVATDSTIRRRRTRPLPFTRTPPWRNGSVGGQRSWRRGGAASPRI